jgi:drug/metabolite transporter (DMT)-like permease
VTDSKNKSILLIGLLAIIWGSSFILMKRALLVYTPYQVGSVRIFLAFLFMLPVVIRHFRTIERKHWKYLAATGFLGNGIPSILFPLAETRISSALAGMINSLTPIFTLLVGMLIFGMRVGAKRILGLVMGLLGAVVLVLSQSGSINMNAAGSYALFVVLATVCYAFSVNILRYKLSNIEPLQLSAFAIFLAGIPLGVFAFSTDLVPRTLHSEGAPFALLCIALLGVLGTAFSTILFNKVIKRSGALAAASVTYLIPFVAVLWGLWDNESLGLSHYLGMAAILAGVWIVNRQR